MQKYVCTVCHYEYDPALGDPDNGIEAGTAFADLPEDWVCPICGVGKDSFSKAEYPKTECFLNLDYPQDNLPSFFPIAHFRILKSKKSHSPEGPPRTSCCPRYSSLSLPFFPVGHWCAPELYA